MISETSILPHRRLNSVMDQVTRNVKSVLRVDDLGIRELLYEIITRLGHSTITAVDGIDALEKLADEHFDIVVTDIGMPRMDGIELFKNVRELYPQTAVIFMSGLGDNQSAENLLKEGASFYFRKPFDYKLFKKIVQNILEEKDLKAEINQLKSALTPSFNER